MVNLNGCEQLMAWGVSMEMTGRGEKIRGPRPESMDSSATVYQILKPVIHQVPYTRSSHICNNPMIVFGDDQVQDMRCNALNTTGSINLSHTTILQDIHMQSTMSTFTRLGSPPRTTKAARTEFVPENPWHVLHADTISRSYHHPRSDLYGFHE